MTQEPNYCCDCDSYRASCYAQECGQFRRGNGELKRWQAVRKQLTTCPHFIPKPEPTLQLTPKEEKKSSCKWWIFLGFMTVVGIITTIYVAYS